MHTKFRKITVLTALIAVIFLGTSWYVHESEADMSAQIQILIAEQDATLRSLAEVTDRDGADAVVSEVIKDCVPVERERFDALLANLGTLKSSELAEVDRLFASCGNFYAERKAVMVARIRREYEVYASYVDLLARIDSRAGEVTYPVDTWKSLVELEATRSSLSSELVQIQLEIITALRGGAAVSSEEIREQIALANEVKETLSYTGVQIDRLRESVQGL